MLFQINRVKLFYDGFETFFFINLTQNLLENHFWVQNKKLILAYIFYLLCWFFIIYNVKSIEQEYLEDLGQDNTFPVFIAVFMIFVLATYFFGTIILIIRRKEARKRYLVFLLLLFIPFLILSLF